MRITADYLVVGSGLTGAVIARGLADSGRDVVVVDRRDHVGGNVHDSVHASGIRIHTYGPHYFRTSSDRIWEFVNRFSRFYEYRAVVKTAIDSGYENWPISASYIARVAGKQWKAGFEGVPSNFEEASLRIMPRVVYEKFVRGYTEKQWGRRATELSAELAGRFAVNRDDEHHLMRHPYQGLPVSGYAGLMSQMLLGIPVLLGTDYLKRRGDFRVKRLLVFTGPVDEYFGFDLGRLEYRGQSRAHQYDPKAELLQPCGQINNPDPAKGSHIRSLEWKHMMQPEYASKIKGSVVTRETPFTPKCSNEYEYPFPSDENKALYARYAKRIKSIPRLLVCGRLGEYRYYDMDQAIARAMVLVDKILG